MLPLTIILKSTERTSAIAGTIFATLACLASADDKSTYSKEAGFVIYSELKLENPTVCISSNRDTVILSLTNKSQNIRTKNTSLIEVSDTREEVVHLEQNENNASLYFEYPNNVYLISIDANTGRLTKSTQSLKTATLNDEDENSTLTLRTKKKNIASSKSPNITKNYLFGITADGDFFNYRIEDNLTKSLSMEHPRRYKAHQNVLNKGRSHGGKKTRKRKAKSNLYNKERK